jgi:hypothetical protein
MVYDRVVDRPGPQSHRDALTTDSPGPAQRIAQAQRRGQRIGAISLFALLAIATGWLATGDSISAALVSYYLFVAQLVWLGIWLALSSLRVIWRVALAVVGCTLLNWLARTPNEWVVQLNLILSVAVSGWSFVMASGWRAIGISLQPEGAHDTNPKGQFTLGSLLAWTALAACVLYVYRHVTRHPETVILAQWQFMWELPRAAYWAVTAILSLATCWSVLGTSPPQRRLAIGSAALFLAIALPMDAWMGITTASFLRGTWLNAYALQDWQQRINVITTLAIIAWIALGVRWWGYRLASRKLIGESRE